MSEHGKIRELLALAAADALTSAEEKQVTEHVRSCITYSNELGAWRPIASELRPNAPFPGTQVSPSFVDKSRFCTRAEDNKSKPPACLSLGLNRWQLAGEASRFPRREFSTALAESIYDNGLPYPQSPFG